VNCSPCLLQNYNICHVILSIRRSQASLHLNSGDTWFESWPSHRRSSLKGFSDNSGILIPTASFRILSNSSFVTDSLLSASINDRVITFSVVTLCSLVEVHRRFRGTDRIRLQGKLSQAKQENNSKQSEPRIEKQAWCRPEGYSPPASCWFICWFTLQIWRWRWYSSSKCRWSSTEIHGVTTQKIMRFVLTYLHTYLHVRTSLPTYITCALGFLLDYFSYFKNVSSCGLRRFIRLCWFVPYKNIFYFQM
jgi:hypothetical protein